MSMSQQPSGRPAAKRSGPQVPGGAAGSGQIGLFIVLLVMHHLSWKPTRLPRPNLRNIWLSFSWIAIARSGIMVIISGGIDLSTGSVMARSGLAAAC